MPANGRDLSRASPALYPQLASERPPSFVIPQVESQADQLKRRMSVPHDLVARRRVTLTAKVASEAGYQLHGISEEGGRFQVFFLA